MQTLQLVNLNPLALDRLHTYSEGASRMCNRDTDNAQEGPPPSPCVFVVVRGRKLNTRAAVVFDAPAPRAVRGILL